MTRRSLWVLPILLCFAVAAGAQMTQGPQYLDYYIVKVKPEKMAAFEAVAKKFVEANRRQKGDSWLAYDTAYGDGYTVYFVSLRSSYGEIEKSSESFMAAMSKAYGEAQAKKIFDEFNSCISGAHGEIRVRRPDLSTKPPADRAAEAKMVGQSRWLRTLMLRVRPGRGAEYEEWLRKIKAAAEKNPETGSVLISQGLVGQQGNVYYISWLRKSLADFDHGPSLMQLLGEGEFNKLQKAVSEVVLTSETSIFHYSPSWSNPPDDVAAADPDFWHPKPKAAKAKAAAGGEEKPMGGGEKPKGKAPAKPPAKPTQ